MRATRSRPSNQADAKKVITFRTSTALMPPEGGSAAVEMIGAAADPGLSTWVEDKVAENRPPRTDIGGCRCVRRAWRWLRRGLCH